MNLLNVGFTKKPKFADKMETGEADVAGEEFKSGCEVQPRHPPLSPEDQELMQEFEENTETIFKQSETCYTHYKAMLRQEK